MGRLIGSSPDLSGPRALLEILLAMLHEHERNHAKEALGGIGAVLDESGLDPMNRPTLACTTVPAGLLHAAKR